MANSGFIYVVSKNRTVDKHELGTQSKSGTGENFSEYSKNFLFAFLPVKCEKCGSMQFLIMDDLVSTGIEERRMGLDVDSALAVSQNCAECDSEITGDILMNNHASEVTFSIDHFDGCEPIVLYDVEKLFLDFKKEDNWEGTE